MASAEHSFPVEISQSGRSSDGRRKISNVPGLVCAFSASVTTGGTIYAFGIYGDALKKSLGLSQMQLDSISATFFIAGLFTWIPGMVVDRKGMRFAMCLGGLSGASAVLVYWAVARQFFPVPHVVMTLSFLAVAICLSCGLIIGSIFKLTLLFGGPQTRGVAVGVAKGYVGLGAGVYATIFQALRTEGESALDFLPVLAFFFILCAAIPAWLLLPTKEQTSPELIKIESTPLHFRTLYLSLLVLGTVIVTTSVSEIVNESKGSGGHKERNYGKVALIMIIWLGPITSLLYLKRSESYLPTATTTNAIESRPNASQSKESIQDEQSLLLSSYKNAPGEDKVLATPVEQRADLTLPEMLRTPSAWLMLWTTTILVGSGTYKTNNMGQMVESLGFSDAITPATLAIFSVAQAAARTVTGVVSEAALQWKTKSCCVNYGVPRPFFLAVASCVAVFSHIMLAVSTNQISFVLGCTISGVAFGMAWPLMVLIVGDIFGLTNHGANYMFYDGFTKAVGTILLSEYVAGSVYEAHVDKSQGDTTSCYGPACFQRTHVVVAGLALTCVAASLLLQFSSRKAYNLLKMSV